MGKRKENEPRVYIIPKNFLDSGYVFGGRFKQRKIGRATRLNSSHTDISRMPSSA